MSWFNSDNTSVKIAGYLMAAAIGCVLTMVGWTYRLEHSDKRPYFRIINRIREEREERRKEREETRAERKKRHEVERERDGLLERLRRRRDEAPPKVTSADRVVFKRQDHETWEDCVQ